MKNQFLFISIVLLPTLAKAQTYTIDQFLNDIQNRNSRLKAAKEFSYSSNLQRAEAKILTTINAFSLINFGSDKKEPQFADFEGTNRLTREFQFGLEQNSSIGISHKLYANYNYINQENANLVPNPEISNSALVYEFSAPLLRNAWGRGFDLQKKGILSRSEALSQQQEFEKRKLISEAYISYWQLKMAQEIVKSQEAMIVQGETFLRWTKGRHRDRLAEDSDLKQAEAILELRKFDLERGKTELLKASQKFNSLRETDLHATISKLQEFPADSKLPILPTREEALKRPDLIALEAQLQAESVEIQSSAENTKVELNLVGSAATNGLSYDADPAYDKTFKGKWPTYAIGLRLTVPLDRGSVDDILKASLARKKGVESSLRRNQYDAIASLSQLQLDYEQLKKQLKLIRKLEEAQREKLEVERKRLRVGRTTTFQVLAFEQEYQQSKQDLIRTQGTLWQLSSEVAFYQEVP